MNRTAWLGTVRLEFGDETAERCLLILEEADARRAYARQTARTEELARMVKTVSAITGSSVYINDIRWVCAALIDAGYRKFEIVEDDV